MELKLVYRILRKISDWTIAGYYSEVYVEDQDIITDKDPVIIAATHHNDIIDVAALAATINHRRPISFWAKSTLFSNPLAGAILSSSGTIPVRRNPNIGNNASTANPSRPASTDGKAPSPPSVETTKEAELSARAALFLTTSQVLGAGQVVGVFCEGASYTASRIVQVLPGTAWAAVEYARYLNEKRKQATGRGYSDGPGRRLDSRLCIVPVAIEYTDKSQYLSRIYIRYGIPIYLDSFIKELFRGDPNEASKAVVKTITAQLEERLIKMTVNIQDWDTLCAVSIARDILWGDEHNVPLKDWVDVMQRLGRMLETPGISKDRSTSESDSVRVLKDFLTRYYALLHYAGMKHSVLSSLLPLATPPASATHSTEEVDPLLSAPKLSGNVIARATVSILMSLPLSLIRFVLFIPPFLLHLPGYFVGPFLARLLATPGEVETIAQYKAIGGGLGIAVNVLLAFGILWRKNNLGALGTLLGLARDDRPLSASLRVLGLVGTVYCSVVLLVKWHKLLIRANYTQLQRILTYWNLVSAFIFPDSLLAAQVEAYTKPEHPAANLWVRDRVRKTASSANGGLSNPNFEGSTLEEQAQTQTQAEAPRLRKPRPIPSRKLVRHVLHARTAASTALWAHLDRTADRDLVAFLNLKGAKFPGSREPFW